MLHLIPNLLHEEGNLRESLPPHIEQILLSLKGIIVETPKKARCYFKNFSSYKRLLQLPMEVCNVHSKQKDIEKLILAMDKGEDWGYLSDSGLPSIADPGDRLVCMARQHNISVKAHVGPSSIYLALMLSGFRTQSFAFYGYVPHAVTELKKCLSGLTHVHMFIEVPYRTNQSLAKILGCIRPTDRLCIACDLMSPKEEVFLYSCSEWKQQHIDLHKRHVIYMISTATVS